MANPLQHTLSRLAESHSRSNPAFNELLSDYSRYHIVLLVFGGLVEFLVVSFCIVAWIKARRAPRTERGKGTFERRTYAAFALFTTVISLAFAVGLVANVTTVLNPWPGFDSLVTALANPQPGTQTAKLFSATNAWIQSGDAHEPAAVHAAVQKRLSGQRPKAIVSTVLMVVLTLISIRIWRRLIVRSRDLPSQLRLRERAVVLVGIGAVLATLLFTVLAVSNMRGTIAPLAITVLQAGH